MSHCPPNPAPAATMGAATAVNAGVAATGNARRQPKTAFLTGSLEQLLGRYLQVLRLSVRSVA